MSLATSPTEPKIKPASPKKKKERSSLRIPQPNWKKKRKVQVEPS